MTIPKFRAWVKDEQRMIGSYDTLAIDYENEEIVAQKTYSERGLEIEKDIHSYDFDDVNLMQSTGLFDVNGKEIFEGDVVELHHFTENYSKTWGFYEGEESLVGIVRYGYTDDEIKYFGKVYPPSWFFENRYRVLDFSDLSGLHEESFKIIGDIYRNPGLLGGK